MKAGTTFLRSYFSHHPNIEWYRNAIVFLSDTFERSTYLDNFENTGHSKCIVDMYEGLAIGFINHCRSDEIRHRFTPDYTVDGNQLEPSIEKIALRIKDTLPHTKILISIRNQIDWLRSYYGHYILKLPKRNRTLHDLLSTFDGKCALYAGNYYGLIKTYIKVFGRDFVHVIVLEELKTNPREALEKLCHFMEVDYVEFPAERQKLNKAKPSGQRHIIKLLASIGISAEHFAKYSPIYKKYADTIYQLFSHDILTKHEISMLHSFYSISNYHLSGLIDVDLKQFGYPL
ncbi:sulfotransferase domain-containing protein [candidate division KSB1 bacterium]|nr:sulfotransferase domain-containing protein [candidate division KSB1 bacterium]